ncbi:hypothetical protein GCK32_021295 [Trichostrongylus colubriformis]|uniref:Uncharacterized protein n=1 Tax=Trichostrongylus colubriformis TaxID=6319 RepID=A0AAN8GC22_TRICO
MLFSKAFGRLGSIVGSSPLKYFIASVVIFALSVLLLVILPPEIRLSFSQGYTTPDAPSIRELKTHVDFFGNKVCKLFLQFFYALG